jgi:hypothetical protein
MADRLTARLTDSDLLALAVGWRENWRGLATCQKREW